MQIQTEKKQQKAHRAHVTHCLRDTYSLLKIMSFISSRVNHAGSVRELSLTIIIPRSKLAVTAWWLSVKVAQNDLITSVINPEQTLTTLHLYICMHKSYNGLGYPDKAVIVCFAPVHFYSPHNPRRSLGSLAKITRMLDPRLNLNNSLRDIWPISLLHLKMFKN